MKVYVAQIDYRYVGQQLVGVYSSKEKADEAAEKARTGYDPNGKKIVFGDGVIVEEFDLELE